MTLTFKNSAGRFYDFIGDIKKYKSLESYMTGLLKFMSSSKAKSNLEFIPADMTINDIKIIEDDNFNIKNFDKIFAEIKKLPTRKKMFESDTIDVDANGFDRRLNITFKL